MLATKCEKQKPVMYWVKCNTCGHKWNTSLYAINQPCECCSTDSSKATFFIAYSDGSYEEYPPK